MHDWKDILARFSDPAGFDVKIREGKYKYIDARDVMDRLDAVVGPENWRQSFRVLDTPACVVECTLIVHDIAKSDVGYPNNPGSSSEKEPFKSAYSDALKRAAVHWGIGRFLYDDDAPAPRQQAQRPAAQPTRAPAATRDIAPLVPASCANNECGKPITDVTVDGKTYSKYEWFELTLKNLGAPYCVEHAKAKRAAQKEPAVAK